MTGNNRIVVSTCLSLSRFPSAERNSPSRAGHSQARLSCEHAAVETEEDARAARALVESESDAAHHRYQQLAGFRRPLLKLVRSLEESDNDQAAVGAVQQMIVSLPVSASFKVRPNPKNHQALKPTKP